MERNIPICMGGCCCPPHLVNTHYCSLLRGRRALGCSQAQPNVSRYQGLWQGGESRQQQPAPSAASTCGEVTLRRERKREGGKQRQKKKAGMFLQLLPVSASISGVAVFGFSGSSKVR